ncbi:MAG: hypothetical protein R2864_09165 [Syntrophotaleaceae bacterium]
MMEDRKIIKSRRQVFFTLADGGELDGNVFLSLYDARHQGPQRVSELLNGEEGFIPVETKDGTVHLNVANIVCAVTPRGEEEDSLMTLGAKHRVWVSTVGGKQIEGEVYVNLPHERCRVSDYLNQPQGFCRIFMSDRIAYLGTRFILSVRD